MPLSRRPGLRLAFLLLAVLLAAGCGKKPADAPKLPPPTIYIQPLKFFPVAGSEEFTGWTVGQRTINIRARVTGYLDKVLFKDGDDVKDGTELFHIDPRTYQAEFDKAQADVRQKEATLERLNADLRRARAMVPGRGISAEELDKIAGNRLEADASVRAARAHLDYARLNLGFTHVKAPYSGRISRTLVDPGNLVKADDTLLTTMVTMDPMHVYFDIDERTVLRLRRLIAQGEIDSAREKRLAVDIALADEEGFAQADDADKADKEGPAQTDRLKLKQGHIDFIDNQLDPGTGTLRVRAEVRNPREKGTYMLSPGMFVRVRVPIGKPKNSHLVPEAALGSDQGRRFIYVVRDLVVAKGDDGKPLLDEKGRTIQRGQAVRIDVKVGPQIDPLEKQWKGHFSGPSELQKKWRVITPADESGEGSIRSDDQIISTGLQRVRGKAQEVTVRPMSELYEPRSQPKPKPAPKH